MPPSCFYRCDIHEYNGYPAVPKICPPEYSMQKHDSTECFGQKSPDRCLPDDNPVYPLKKVMEELDFSGLLTCYSDKGRTGYNPIMMYAVVTYANMRGIRAVDRIVELCERDLAFIWLTRGQKPRRDAFYDFKGKKLTGEVLDELNYQFLRRLKKEGLVIRKELFIDGTK